MSTQLILYPQSYKGVYSFNSENEFIVDGMNFSSINSSTSYSTTTTIDNHLFATPPSIVNTWFRWRTTPGGAPALPVETSGNLVLNAVGASSISGVYQKLTNLTVGASYTLTVTMTPAAGLINLKAFNLSNNSVIVGSLLSSNTTQQAITFLAQTTTDTVAILYYNTAATNLTISSISLSPTLLKPFISDLTDGQVICDLYEEEDIPLTLSIDDFKNVAEQVKSYSKDFNLPATKRNNRIFNNMFEVTRADDGLIFNPYVKTQCVLKQDGFILFEGYLRMIDVKDNEGEISYNVNLYSEVVALADTLKEVTFAELDFTELEHAYHINNITDSWNDSLIGITYLNPNTSGYRSANSTVKYPNIDWNHQFSADPTTGNPVLPNLESMFRPCIQLKYLINRIFANTTFSWTSNFFDSADFGKLYMDFNWGSSGEIIEGNGTYEGTPTNNSDTTYKPLQLQSGYTNFPIEFGYSIANFNFVAANNGTTYTFNYAFPIYMNSTDDLHVRWERRDNAGTLLESIDSGGWASAAAGYFVDYVGNFTITLNQGDTVQPVFRTNVAATATQGWVSWNYTAYVNATVGALNITTEVFLETLRGELGQWDFLKGIMTMFNLVTMVDEDDPNNILIEPYSDVFINNTNSGNTGNLTLAARSIQHDWTDKVDVSQMELKPLTDLNKDTIFKFVEDDDDYAFNVYKQSTSGHLYGSKKIDASTSTANNLPTVLQGTKEIIAEPFAATVSKPLMPQFPDFVVPSLYTMSEDGTAEGFENSPRIFYNNGKKVLTSCTYDIPAQNSSAAVPLETTILQFSHLSEILAITSSRDFVFESQQLWPGVATNIPTDNLYSIYWQPYFNELYNADTRTMTLKVNLTPSDIANFKFFDMVFIKNRSFRVNKIEYKPNSLATVEFILIP